MDQRGKTRDAFNRCTLKKQKDIQRQNSYWFLDVADRCRADFSATLTRQTLIAEMVFWKIGVSDCASRRMGGLYYRIPRIEIASLSVTFLFR